MAKGKLGLMSCTALIIGACIGSAIFSVSGITVLYAGPSAILSWILAALIYGLYGIVLARLAGRYPHSGGVFVFPKRAFGGAKGKILGFISSWAYLVSSIIAIGFSAIYTGIYLQSGFPSIGSPMTVSVISCIAACLVVLLGTNRTKKVQNVLVLLLLLCFAAYCGTALFGGRFTTRNFNAFFTAGISGKYAWISSIPLAMIAYGGCVSVAFMVSEVEDPQKNVPKSLGLGLGIVALIYALVIACIVGTLPMYVIKDEPELSLIPIAASISTGYLKDFPWLLKIMSISAYLALFTSIVAIMQVNSRSMEKMAAEGTILRSFYNRNSRSVPTVSVIAMTVISIVLCTLRQYTENLVNLGAVLSIIPMAITCLSLKEKRTLPIIVLCIFLVCFIPDLSAGKQMWIFTAAVYLLGILVYLLTNRRKHTHISGTIIHGKGHGGRFGMPTANLEPYPREKWPNKGVWETIVYYNGTRYKGLTNVGLRPSDDNSKVPTIETLILDFDENIYGNEMTLEFVRYIRPTLRFNSLQELKQQIDKDIETVNG